MASRTLNAGTYRILDVIIVVWIVVWIVLGVVVWNEIRAQAGFSESFISLGKALSQTGEALAVVGNLPLIGGSVGDVAQQVTTAGADLVASGEASRGSTGRLALLAGLAVAVWPAVMVLIAYLPGRLAWRRDRLAVRQGLSVYGGAPGFEHYLAMRAVTGLPWDSLQGITTDPGQALARGDVRALADAELARLGLARRRR
jgi:hypothetical protein